MKVSFHPEAAREFVETVDYYEELEKGLGVEFMRKVYNGIELISIYPDAWQKLSSHIRRYLINRFPYGLIYRKEEDDIYILAVMQMNREPDYWENRQ